jgi:predicted deacylase
VPRGDGTHIRLPLVVVNGAHEGPTFVASGGVHGDEYEGPEAILRTWSALDPQQLKGTFVGVPVVNVTAVEAASRKSPIDGFDLNRIFPGRADGYISEKTAHFFFHEIVLKADGYLDLHAAGNGFAIAPMGIYLETGDDEFKARELAFAKAAGVDLLWKGRGLWSAPHVEGVKRGIPGITVELGQEGRCSEPLVALGEQIMLNLMKHLGIIEGTPQLPEKRTIVKGTYLHSQAGGIFHPRAEVRQAVKRGDTVGVITDYIGETLETIEAPCDGIICSTRTFPAIRPGEWTVFVGEVVEETW